MTDRIFSWPVGRTNPGRRNRTTGIAVHCSATREGQPFDATDIDGWHRKQGWAGIGYHYVVHLDGTVEAGRPEDFVGSGIQGHNAELIHVVYIGGTDANGTAKDTRTADQKVALSMLVRHLIAKYRKTITKIGGHRDWSPDRNHNGNIEPNEWLKACPSFDVAAWLKAERITY